MTDLHAEAGEREVLRELPEGMLDYQARCSIRDLVRLYGFEEARQLVAMYLNDEADRRQH